MYGFKRKKIFLYSMLGVIFMFALSKYEFATMKNSEFLQNSFVSILNGVAENHEAEPPDLGIEKVTLKKIADPTDRLNYYKYSANIVLKNHGGDLRNAQLSLNAGEDQKTVFVKNEIDGFSLAKGQSYIIDNYEILFDGSYNGGKITVKINLPKKLDYYAGNNKYEVEIFELPAKIEGLGIEKIKDDGTFVLEFQLINSGLTLNNFEIYASDILEADEIKEKYAETRNEAEDKIYGYHRVKNSPEILLSERWELKASHDSSVHTVKFEDDSFADSSVHYIYLKSTNAENGNYAISNILKFSPQKELDRAGFAKLFVDYSGIDVYAAGENYFDDVNPEAWYAPYVQTIYNLGLIKNGDYKYNPDMPMTRGDVLRVALDYFDVDLSTAYGGPHFEDVYRNHYLYPYVEALFASGKGGVFGENFSPESAATKNYLKYLVNEYKENS